MFTFTVNSDLNYVVHLVTVVITNTNATHGENMISWLKHYIHVKLPTQQFCQRKSVGMKKHNNSIAMSLQLITSIMYYNNNTIWNEQTFQHELYYK